MTRMQKTHADLVRLRNAYKRRIALIFLTAAGAGVALLYSSFVILDLLIQFPSALCWFAWIVLLGIAGTGGVFLLGTCRRRISDAAMAVRVEKALPSAQNRLINAVQLASQSDTSRYVAEKLLSEHELPIDRLRTRDVTPQRRFQQLTAILLGALVVVGIVHIVAPAQAVQSGKRLLLPMGGYRPYTQTLIESVLPGDITVPRGNSIEIQVRIGGVQPKSVTVEWRRSNVTETTLALAERNDDSNDAAQTVFSGNAYDVLYDARYRVVAGDARSKWHSVEVTSPPGLLSWSAEVNPPAYLGRPGYELNADSASPDVPAGADIILTGKASAPLSSVTVVRNTRNLQPGTTGKDGAFRVAFNIGGGGRIRLRLTSEARLETEETLPFVVVLDQPPSVRLSAEKNVFDVQTGGKLPVEIRASDDHGITLLGLEKVGGDGKIVELLAQQVDGTPQDVERTLALDVDSLGLRTGQSARCRAWAEDNAPGSMRHRAYSQVFTVRIPQPREQREDLARQKQQVASRLAELIRMQRDNLHSTRALADLAIAGRQVPATRLDQITRQQTAIRTQAIAILEAEEVLGDLRNNLSGLINHEMAEVLLVLNKARKAGGGDIAEHLAKSVRIETEILASLAGMPGQLDPERRHQEAVDLLERLEKLVGAQAANLKNTRAATPGASLAPFAREQENIAVKYIAFQDQCWVVLDQVQKDDFHARVRDVYDLFAKEQVYENVLIAADSLAGQDRTTSIAKQEAVLKVLLRGLDIMNQWRVKNAREKLQDLAETLEQLKEGLEELDSKQARIAEVTRDLAERGKLDDETREELGKMDREQEEMADMVEQLAQDLYQFPEMPVSNELNSKMHEIYEAIDQAANSENAPAIEIAVQKEDGVLDAIRKTKERVEDVEMWLEDVPDHIAWKMESFDADEMPDIPLVPLPEELEDMVGELLDQASSIDEQSQDSTGNQMMADGEMGWGVADGPIPNWSAKGKSGNTKPNDNEMTGRSGAGREGQASGELVEDHVKGLEGRETHARRTRDPFQQGQVTEDENSTLDAKSTGGGKLGGESESQGMFDNAPRRDQHVPDHGAQAKLRRETEALYATARLLYLGTGKLGSVARDMRELERQDIPEMQSFDSLHKKVMRSLDESRVEIDSGVVLPMPVNTINESGGAASQDIDISKIHEEYRGVISDYYKGLSDDE